MNIYLKLFFVVLLIHCLPNYIAVFLTRFKFIKSLDMTMDIDEFLKSHGEHFLLIDTIIDDPKVMMELSDEMTSKFTFSTYSERIKRMYDLNINYKFSKLPAFDGGEYKKSKNIIILSPLYIESLPFVCKYILLHEIGHSKDRNIKQKTVFIHTFDLSITIIGGISFLLFGRQYINYQLLLLVIAIILRLLVYRLSINAEIAASDFVKKHFIAMDTIEGEKRYNKIYDKYLENSFEGEKRYFKCIGYLRITVLVVLIIISLI